jgi:hypothetical protein
MSPLIHILCLGLGLAAYLLCTSHTTTLTIIGCLLAIGAIICFILCRRAPLGYQDYKGFHYGIPAKGHLTDEDTRYPEDED